MCAKSLFSLIAIAVLVCFGGHSWAYVSEPLTGTWVSDREPTPENALKTPSNLAHWQLPVKKGSPITSCYGPRVLLNQFSDFHDGIDFGVKSKTPVQAVASGKVLWIGFSGCSGRTVILQHKLSNKRTALTLYRHLAKYKVKVGDVVKSGQVIALSGASGRPLNSNQDEEKRGCVSGPHLHLEFKLLKAGLSPLKTQKLIKKSKGHLAGITEDADPTRFIPLLRKRCS